MLTRPPKGAPSGAPGGAPKGAPSEAPTDLPGADLTIWFEGAAIAARAGDSVAVALLAGGIVATRTTAVSGRPRGPFCMMGVCFDCLAVVDGIPNVQTCMTSIRDGMRVLRQHGAREIGPEMGAK